MDYKMVYSSYMVINGGSICGLSTLWMHRCNTKHTKSSARVMIDEESLDKAPGQICTQYRLMDHMEDGGPHLSESENRVVCVCLCFTQPFWYLVV